jgi:protein-disulfide isomerase
LDLGTRGCPVTLLEYGDFECPYCAMARPVLEGLVAEYPEDIRLVFRHFPVTTTHPHARIAAESAEAAGAQGQFWEMHDMLFTHQDRLAFEDLRRYAHALGLDLSRFDQEMVARVYQAEVQRDFRRGIQDGVNGTPSIFINGLRYDGPRDRASILSAVAAQIPA